jgi:hypothetical protein
MKMTAAREWLDRREADVPVSMQAPIRSALERTGEGDVTARDLVDAAVICLRDALERGESRSAAVHLLSADALLTWAFGEAALDGSAAVLDLADRAALVLARVLPDPPA